MKIVKTDRGKCTVLETGDSTLPVPTDDSEIVSARVRAIDWSVEKQAKEKADAEDARIIALINSAQANRDAVKAMTAKSYAPSHARELDLWKCMLYLLRGDKNGT